MVDYLSLFITKEQAIDSLERAQELKDARVIGQARDFFAYRDESNKQCFCAVGAIVADRMQPLIDEYGNFAHPTTMMKFAREKLFRISPQLITDGVATESSFNYITALNDYDNLSFSEIANKLKELA